MAKTLPTKARVVIVGGGVIGCSIAYHLTKIGWDDVVLLERKQLTCGTTWHAAGLIGQLRDSQNMTKLAKYTAELYLGLEAETGQATGYKINGSLSLADNAGRFEDLKRRADMAKVFDLKVDVLGPEGCKDLYPLLNVDDILGGIFIPSDGQANPIDITQALAKGARMGGAEIHENVEVIRVLHDGEKVSGVKTATGTINADYVVLACGMWTREFAKDIGVNVPLHACEHFYVVTEPMANVTPDLPVMRDYDAHAYYKEDAGKLLLGAFEPVAKPWGMNGISPDFCFDELPDDFDHFAPILERAMHRVPALEQTGIQKFFCGPESFTHDDRYHIGAAPELSGLFVAAGLNSIGIQSAGGIGKVLAEWMRDGHPPSDLASVDIRRNMPFQGGRKYLHDRVTETLGLLYAVHWPFYQYKTARDIRRSPFHDRLRNMGACFGEAAGWERTNWFAPKDVKPEYVYSYTKQNWFDSSAREHWAIRENVGVIDMTSFAKFRLQGRDALAVINRVSANNMDVDVGRIVYTSWLNDHGGIEADLTVTRIGANDFMIVTSGTSQVRDLNWLNRSIKGDEFAIVTDITSSLAVLSVMGPKSRELLSKLTPEDLSNDAFPFAHSRDIELGYAKIRASRITYVGELGWELYIPTEFAVHVFDELIKAGNDFDLKPVGLHAMNSLRIEKGYRHWGHDITDFDTPLQAGLSFAVAWDKPGGFVGRDALIKQKQKGVERRLVQFKLADKTALLYHNEPVYRDGEIVGYITSAMYGHTVGAAIGMAYVDGVKTASDLKSGQFEIDVAGHRIQATPSLSAFYDAKNERIKI